MKTKEPHSIRAISMPKKTYSAAVAEARKKGLTFSAWVRQMIMKEISEQK
jgi:hypothetical protein